MNDASLAGVGVAVTRGERGDGPLSRLLKERGATVLDWGSVAFEAPEDPGPFLSALKKIQEFDWICFSSPRAVDAVVSRVPDPPSGVLMAAVGPSTAACLEEKGWPCHRVPDGGKGSGQALVSLFERHGDAVDARVLFPASALARRVIPDGLIALGAAVESVTAYRLVTLSVDPAEVDSALETGRVRVITFASPSALEGLRSGIGPELTRRLAEEVTAVAMGPTTAGAVRSAGWSRIVVARIPDFESVVDAAAEAARL